MSMTCDNNTLLLISSYVDGETNPEETLIAESHLEQCAQCRRLVETWQRQREMLEWAYTCNMPEQVDSEWQKSFVSGVKKMPIVDRLTRPFRNAVRPVSLAWAMVLMLVVIIGLGIRHFTLAPYLGIGDKIISSKSFQSARMDNGIQLKIGPNSKVVRVGEKSLRLEKGWIYASVRHGSGLKIFTRRLEVRDQGTKFRVGTGDKLDYVIVDEGMVAAYKGKNISVVTAGKALLAADKGRPQVVSLPMDSDSDNQQGQPLIQESPFIPSSALDLDWREGLERLSKRFPNLRWSGDVGGGTNTQENGIEIRASVGSMANIKSGVRDHFVDIVQAMAGDRVDSDGWEMPVGFIQTSTILTNRKLPGDVYLIRLICKGGSIVWNLTGSNGTELELPFFNSFSRDSKRFSSSGDGGSGLLNYSHTSWHDITNFSLKIACWPGDMKPTLNLTLEGVPRTTTQPEIADFMTQITNQTAKMQGYQNSYYGNLLYLDRNQKHGIVICWNKNADKDISQLLDNLKQGKGGSAMLGAVATDSSLEEPKLPAGVYLLKLIASDNTKKPYIEIIRPNVNGIKIALRSTPMTRLEKKSVEFNNISTHEISLAYGKMNLCYGVKSAEQGSFSFHFGIMGDHDMFAHNKVRRTMWSNPDKVWAEGYIRVKEP